MIQDQIKKIVDEYFNSNTTDLKLSRETVREVLTSKLYEVFSLLNYKYDTSNSSFSQLLVNLFSAVIGDLLAYSNFLYGESTLVTAQLYESIYNWATMLDYQPNLATPAITTVQFSFPYEQSFNYQIVPFVNYYKAKNGVLFTPVNRVDIQRVFNNQNGQDITITQYVTVDNYIQQVPMNYVIANTPNGKRIVFNLGCINLSVQTLTIVSDNYSSYEQFEYTVNLQNNEYLYDIKVTVNGEQFTKGNLQTSSAVDKIFDIVFNSQNSFTIKFGNNIKGVGIEPGSVIEITLYVTNGSYGNINKFDINEKIDDNTNVGIVEYYVLNIEKGTGGLNSPTDEQIKTNTIIKLRTKDRLVTLQDFVDFLKLYPFVSKYVILQKESDVRTNDIYLYVVLQDDNGNIIPTDTISVDYEQLKFNLSSQLVQQGQIQVINWENQLLRFEFNPVYDYTNTYVVPGYLFIDINKYTWYLVPMKEILLDYKLVSFVTDNVLAPVTISTYLTISNNMYVFKFVFTYNKEDSQPINSFLQSVDKKIVVTNPGQTLMYNLTSEQYTISSDGNSDVYILEFQVPVKYVSLFGRKSDVVVQFINSITDKFEYFLVPELTSVFYDYGPLVSINSKLLIVDLPVVDSTYTDIDYVMQKFKTLSDDFTNSTTKRMLNLKPHVRFVKTDSYIRNVHYSKGDYSVVDIIQYSLNNNIDVNGNEVPVPCTLDITDPNIYDTLATFTNNNQPGYYAIQSTKGVGSYIYNSILNKIIEVPNSTFVHVQNHNSLYVTVDNLYHKVSLQNPLKISVVISLNSIPTTYEAVSCKVKEMIANYINSKNPNENIYFSELVNLLQSVPEIKNVRFIEPKYDIIFNYDVNDLSLTDYLTYVPEYVYTTVDSITVQFE